MIALTKEDKKLVNRFARRMSDRMAFLEMSQSQLSKISGVSRPEICQLMRGRKAPLITTAMKIARALNIELHELIN